MSRSHRNLLLLSNGSGASGTYLSDVPAEGRELLRSVGEILFVPYAQVTRSWDQHTTVVEDALGCALRPLHRERNHRTAIKQSEMIMVSGGNTFHLLHHLRSLGLLSVLRQAALTGTPYLGWSAGANVASPTICTTNDMPIIDPCGLEALELVDFQINPHYTDMLPEGSRAERRHQRIAEFVTFNPQLPVLGLAEGAWIRVVGDRCELGGEPGSYWFRHRAHPEPAPSGVFTLTAALAP